MKPEMYFLAQAAETVSDSETLLDWIAVLASPVILVLAGVIGAVIKSKSDELRAIEARLQESQEKVYLVLQLQFR